MTSGPDRLYDLLPAEYRIRDAELGWQLRALLRVIAEQVDVVERDIEQLYDNWFIETCQDWVVPYIGDLVGYRPVPEAGRSGPVTTAEGRLLDRILVPRREVANTLRDRRRKGALALLEMLALEVAGWPARAVEFFRLLARNQAIDYPRPGAGGFVSLHDAEALDRIDGPFDPAFHTVDVRRPNSSLSRGRYSIPSVGVFVWRLKAYSVTRTLAYRAEDVDPQWFTFSVLGNDTPLFARPRPEPDPTDVAEEANVPAPIRRPAMARHPKAYYGEGKSLLIWTGTGRRPTPHPIDADRIRVASLDRWAYEARPGTVLVDPQLGRIGFPPDEVPRDVWVSYHHGFSADIGGGEYRRPVSAPAGARVYRVARSPQKAEARQIGQALDLWVREGRPPAVVEIADNGVYEEPVTVRMGQGATLQLRAAQGRRPVIRLLDRGPDRQDFMIVTGGADSRFTLDGILVTGRGIQIRGRDLASVTIRHSTLVPGWGLWRHMEPTHPAEPSVELFGTQARLRIERSIVGSIHVHSKAGDDPVQVRVQDSVLDATSGDRTALTGEEGQRAHADLTILRTTVFGRVCVRAIPLAENSIFTGTVTVARRQVGCMRFCYVPPGSTTPRRYECQPDLAVRAATVPERAPAPPEEEAERRAAVELAGLRVRPVFTDERYGTPGYAQLAPRCADEITRGADDRSEMGVFHDLFQAQRAANLRARLEEYTPADMDVGLFFAT